MIDLIRQYLLQPEESIDHDDFLRLASAGETRYVERKSLQKLNDSARIKDLTRAVSGFANYDGGVILLGVSNTGEVESGVEDAQGTGSKSEWLQDIISGAITPLFTHFSVKKVRLRGNDPKSYVYSIFVGPGDTAYQANDNCYYARVDGKLRPIDGRMVLDILNRKRNSSCKLEIGFDSIPFFGESKLGLSFSIEVANDVILEDTRLAIRTFDGNWFEPDETRKSEHDKGERSWLRYWDKQLLFPGEKSILIAGKLRLESLPLNRPYFEVVLFSRNARLIRQAFVFDTRPHQWVGLYEYPVPRGDMTGKQLWRYSKEWLEPMYVWDSNSVDRRSALQKNLK